MSTRERFSVGFRCGVVVYHMGWGMMSPGSLLLRLGLWPSVHLVRGAQPGKGSQ